MTRYWHSSLNLIAAYLIGLMVGTLIFLPYFGAFAPSLVMIGALTAWPLLVVALVVLWLFRESIDRHLLAWCLAAPFAVSMGWLLLDYVSAFVPSGWGFGRYLWDRGTWEQAALAFACAAASAAAFHLLSRSSRRAGPDLGS
jgi:hypothetical protein